MITRSPVPNKEVLKVHTTKAKDHKAQPGRPQHILELKVHLDPKAHPDHPILAHQDQPVHLPRILEPQVHQVHLQAILADLPLLPALQQDIPVVNLNNLDSPVHHKVLQRAIQHQVVRLRHSLVRNQDTHLQPRKVLLQGLVDQGHQDRVTRLHLEVIQVRRLRILDKDHLSANLRLHHLDIHNLADLAYPSQDPVLLSQEEVLLSLVQVRQLDLVHHSRRQENICRQLLVK